jgi:LysM repeat protein
MSKHKRTDKPGKHKLAKPNRVPHVAKLALTTGVVIGASAAPASAYTIKSGDTLSEIAHRHDTSVRRLVRLNHIENPDLIYAGDHIRLHGKTGRHVRTSRSGERHALDGRPQTIPAFKAYVRGKVGAGQFWACDQLFMHESGWNRFADNPTSSAFGIPQALTSLHALPRDYMWNGYSQLDWGLSYIRGRYGSCESAWSFWKSHQWY